MCLHPIKAWWSKAYNDKGVRHLHFVPPSDVESFYSNLIQLPCGKCPGCLDDRRKRWVNRLLLEYDSCLKGSFITLTYADAPDRPLKSDVQNFLKRFRNIPRDFGLPRFPYDFKYFFCGECGGKRGRPHYHGLLFGLDLLSEEWQPYIATFNERGEPLLSSKILEKKWNKGFCTVDSITPNRCRYIAKYTMKQVGQEDSFILKSPRLGVSSFFHWLRRGRHCDFAYRYSDSADRLMDGNIHVQNDGKLFNVRIPPSILEYLKRIDRELYDDIKLQRQLDAISYAQKSFDKSAYLARLANQQYKQNLTRKLHK